ncbi:MAG: chemotaxis protein CheA [Oligoflexus sp.]
MDEFEKQLKLIFLDEAEQMLNECEQNFLQLETNPSDLSVIERIFRVAHSFKGSAGVAGFEDLSKFAHHLESFLVKLKTSNLPANPHVIDILLRANDEMTNMIHSLKANLDQRFPIDEFIATIDATDISAHPTSTDENPTFEGDSNNYSDQHENSINQFTEQIEIKTSANKTQNQENPSIDENIRVNLRRIDELVNDVGELVILQTVLYEHRHLISSNLLQRTVTHLEKITRKIQDTSMSLRMVPIKQTFQKMQRIIRDTAQQLHKNIVLETTGENTEIDKTILDMLSDPLSHLIRNACDHGIESPEERQNNNKSVNGKIALRAFQRGEHIIVEIEDDGRGLNRQKIIDKAVNLGIIESAENLDDSQVHKLIFMPGFSTQENLTSISGRGVGMDVVKTNVDQMQGSIEIESSLGRGTCFRILLPLTMAIIDGMIVTANEHRYVIPIAAISESLHAQKADISYISGQGHFLSLRGETIQLFVLSEVLGNRRRESQITDGIAIIGKGKNGRPFSILVDDIISQQQIVIKRLGDELVGLPGFSGAAILGDGKAALIIDLANLISTHSQKHQHKFAQREVALCNMKMK